MGRDQDPFVGQGVSPAVRVFREFQVAASGHFTTNGRRCGADSFSAIDFYVIDGRQACDVVRLASPSRDSRGGCLYVSGYWAPAESKVSGGSKKHLCQRAESDKVPARHCCSAGMVAAIMPPSAESKITTIPAGAAGACANSL